MGLLAARQLRAAPQVLDPRLIGFGLLMPLVGAACGLGAGMLAGLSPGGVALMAVLAGSASYIAVPAAMRLALPEADPGVYVTLSLAVTFPSTWCWASRSTSPSPNASPEPEPMTHTRKRIEIVVEAVRAEQVTDLLDACGASGWTIMPVVSGRGRTGMRRGGDLAGVFDNVLVLCIASEAVVEKVLEAREELLGARPAIVSVSDCAVLRAEHFR